MFRRYVGAEMKQLLAVAVAGGLALVGLYASYAYGGSYETARWLLAGALWANLIVLFYAVSAKGDRTFGLLYALFGITILTLPAMIQAARGYFPFYSKIYPEAGVTSAAAMVLIFSVLTGASYLLVGRGHSWAVDQKSGVRRSVLLLTAVAFAALAFLAASRAGIETFTVRRIDAYLREAALRPDRAFLVEIVRAGAFLAFAATILLWRTSPARLAWVPLVVGAGALFLFFNNPINTPRFRLMSAAITLIVIFAPTGSKGFKALFACGYLIALITLFPFLHQLSRAEKGTNLFVDAVKYYGSSGDFDAFQSVINVYYLVESRGVTWGQRLISDVLVFVPREIWPDKAVPTGAEAARHAGYSFVNISAPLPAEFYADFGWAGAALGGALIGLLIARLDSALDAAKRGGSPTLLLLFGLAAGYSTILMRGSILGVIGPIALSLLLAWMIDRLARRQQPAQTRSGT